MPTVSSPTVDVFWSKVKWECPFDWGMTESKRFPTERLLIATLVRWCVYAALLWLTWEVKCCKFNSTYNILIIKTCDCNMRLWGLCQIFYLWLQRLFNIHYTCVGSSKGPVTLTPTTTNDHLRPLKPTIITDYLRLTLEQSFAVTHKPVSVTIVRQVVSDRKTVVRWPYDPLWPVERPSHDRMRLSMTSVDHQWPSHDHRKIDTTIVRLSYDGLTTTNDQHAPYTF